MTTPTDPTIRKQLQRQQTLRQHVRRHHQTILAAHVDRLDLTPPIHSYRHQLHVMREHAHQRSPVDVDARWSRVPQQHARTVALVEEINPDLRIVPAAAQRAHRVFPEKQGLPAAEAGTQDDLARRLEVGLLQRVRLHQRQTDPVEEGGIARQQLLVKVHTNDNALVRFLSRVAVDVARLMNLHANEVARAAGDGRRHTDQRSVGSTQLGATENVSRSVHSHRNEYLKGTARCENKGDLASAQVMAGNVEREVGSRRRAIRGDRDAQSRKRQEELETRLARLPMDRLQFHKRRSHFENKEEQNIPGVSATVKLEAMLFPARSRTVERGTVIWKVALIVTSAMYLRVIN